MNGIVQVCAWVALLPSLAVAAPGIQEVLTPAQYFECQVAARQATIVGLKERAAQLGQTNLTQAQKTSSAEAARARVTLAMYNCGRQNAGTLGAYAHRHADVLKTWLSANPQMKARLDALSQQIASLSTQMPATAPSARR